MDAVWKCYIIATLLCLCQLRPACSQAAPAPLIAMEVNCPQHGPDGPIALYASVNIKSDISISAIGTCRNNRTVEFIPQDDGVSYNLLVWFIDGTDSESGCVFQKKDKTETYYIRTDIAWGDKTSPVFTLKERRLITCTYDDHGDESSKQHNVSEWFWRPLDNNKFVGSESTASFQLHPVDVEGAYLPFNIPLGKKIRLLATVTNQTLNDGFRALSCIAKNDVVEYSVLRAGCGDGIVFPTSAGFYSYEKSVSSPFFSAFQLPGTTVIRFYCDFVECQGGCIGDSCSVVRRKRGSYTLVRKGVGNDTGVLRHNSNLIKVSTGYHVITPSESRNSSHVVNGPAGHSSDSAFQSPDLRYVGALIGLVAVIVVFLTMFACARRMRREQKLISHVVPSYTDLNENSVKY